MKDNDLLIYSATALRFSLNDKFWGEAYICTDTAILELMHRCRRVQWKILKLSLATGRVGHCTVGVGQVGRLLTSSSIAGRG
jgi:hypothetical protein